MENLTEILESLESFDAARIETALQQAGKSPELKQRLEKRYLKLIRTLLDNPAAQLTDFPKVFSTDERVSKTLEDVFYSDGEKLEFVYLSHEEAKDVVDIVGTIVSNHVNIDDYIGHAGKTESVDGLGSWLFPKIEDLKNGINEEVEAYPAGWYGQICIHMMKSLIYGIGEFVIMKSWLKKANTSTVLKEFNFFLAAASTQNFILLQFRNIMDHALDFTEVLWLFGQTPAIFYPADYDARLPACVLPYNRTIRTIRFTQFYEPDGSINVGNIIARDGVLDVSSSEL